MKINEIFKACQGEGKEVGVPTVFVRLSGCNLNCAFCDSCYHIEFTEMDFDELEKQIKSFNIPHVTFTGGEPALQNIELTTFIGTRLKGYETSVETNGTILIAPVFDNITISPKKECINNEVLNHYTTLPNTTFKFVYENKDDLWWEDVININNIPKDKVYIMPEGAYRDEQIERMPEVIDYCLKYNYKFSPRIHVLAFNDKRGV
jgi:7-carboxy-7-deazaguanine synthase